MTGTGSALLTSIARLAHFTKVMYKPHYLLYAIVWVLALEGTAALLAQPDTAWRPTGATALRIVVVAITLLYLRMVDEQKDLDYDRVQHPDRPLVTGAVSATELRAAMAVLAIAAMAISLTFSPRSAVLLAAVLAYALLLWGSEQRSNALRTNVLLNLAITYPIQFLVISYVVVSAADTGELRLEWRTAAVALISTGVFLHFEVARKTTRDQRPGELLYSNALGPTGSALTVLLLAGFAVASYIVLVRPLATGSLAWIAVALMLLPAAATWRFVRSSRPEYPVLPAVAFTLLFYLTLIAQALSPST
ncbi:UbiA family prenyltransferase [Nocardia goodfellowii]